jgi:outer membrane protein assembly factor BamD (BamD/ComL family)
MQTEPPDSRLRRIFDLYEQGENIAAAQALDEFRRAFPDHPVSRLLLERGY